MPTLLRCLSLVERYGRRCGGPVLLVGFVLGAGVVQLASGPLGQTSRFSLELLVLAAVGGGLLASPRADLLGEWRDILSKLPLLDLLRSMARAALFMGAICAWTRWRRAGSRGADHSLELFTSNLLVEGLMVLMTLKLAWIMAVEPLNLSASP